MARDEHGHPARVDLGMGTSREIYVRIKWTPPDSPTWRVTATIMPDEARGLLARLTEMVAAIDAAERQVAGTTTPGHE